MQGYQGIKMNLATSEVTNSIGSEVLINDKGLGPQYIIYTCLKLMEIRKILPTDKVMVDDFIEKESKLDGSLLFKSGEECLALELIQLAIITQKTSTIFALAKLIKEKTKKKISHYFEGYKKETLSPCIENVSGKKSSLKQYYKMDDLIVLGKKIAQLRPEYIQLLHSSEMVFKGRHLLSSNFSVKNGRLQQVLSWDTPYSLVGIENLKTENNLIILINVPNVYIRDYFVDCLLMNESPLEKKGYLKMKKTDVYIEKDAFSINIIGDTYPGEFYSDRRSRAGRWDPLLEEGYDYCFKSLKKYLDKASLNIANFEAALVEDRSKSRLWAMKKFVLGGLPDPTIEALKTANIHAVLLANNHLADYGTEGIISTKRALQENQIAYTGIGEDLIEAARPLRIKTPSREIVLFNAYWFRQANYRYFDFYPGVNKAGVNCLDGILLDQIKWEKEQHPNNYIIVSPHWGVDFLMTSKLQTNLAKKIVRAGADLVIGHGPHTLQKIDSIDGKPVIYSIGNGFFNSDGEYDGYPQSVPYGMIAELKGTKKKMTLCLRPIYANNRETKWQPNFVSTSDFNEVIEFFERENSDLKGWRRKETSIELTLPS